MAVEVEDLAQGVGEHAVQFYDHESQLAETVGRYLCEAVQSGAVAIAIATESHRRAFAAEMEAAGVDPVEGCRNGTLILLDAAATMASFTLEGRIDSGTFREVVGPILRQAGATGRPIRAYGEMVSLLWDAGDVLAAIELEKLWNELGNEVRFSLLCGYHSQSVQRHEHPAALEQVCHLHSSVLATPTRGDFETRYSAVPTEVSAEFSAERHAPSAARHFVAGALRRWGHDGALLDDAQLLVTELATNAVVHAHSPFSVSARTDDSGVRVSVRDASPVRPMLRNAGPLATRGRGLWLVSELSAAWGVEVTSEGKTVWAELQA